MGPSRLVFTEEQQVSVRQWKPLIASFACLLLASCGLDISFNKKAPPPPTEYSLGTPYADVRTLAIAPAVNLSGVRDFDPLTISDRLFEEMHQVAGLQVLPLNKTLIAMTKLGIRSIDTPEAAQAVAREMAADGLIIPAVTAYDPYNPPTLGMSLQLYTTRNMVARPSAEARRIDGTIIANGEDPAAADARQPVSAVSAVFDAHNQTVLRELRDYAAGRTEYDSALREQKFLLDMEQYSRFVCHAMARRLLEVERTRVTGR